MYYKQPDWAIRTHEYNGSRENFGTIPLGLMSVIPGNQTYFTIENTFSNLNFYEFVTDQYATLSGITISAVGFFARIHEKTQLENYWCKRGLWNNFGRK
jgi:hypothetical protein